MKNQNKNCQSCSMPLKRDEKGGGTEKDGSKSTMYCSNCYEKGAFLNPEIDSAEKMRELVKDRMKAMGFPAFLGNFFTKQISKLERWNNN